ncbi:hypothetical protein [Mesomycoplasma ovipneumoniae]|uniref:DUF3137 domain-containing protein n=1 Tax=Mesomycoplasma ovipneumoniae TaxID=29562 RepID=A0AAJ2P767_9BACT|nr:hypothetical protein [Mesomycoplasma ovipneumoniae]MDW2893491.1 DUF3137 domain-containing protein [Mesomycoplasma ovipneumoniae]
MTNRIPDEVYAPAILRPEDAYKTAFSILDKRIDYLGFNNDPYNEIRISRNEIRQFTTATTFHWRGNRDTSWPEISSVEPLKELLIDKKFHVVFTNVHWEWEEIRQNPNKIRREDITIEHKISTGILKIDTSILREKAFDFKHSRADNSLYIEDNVELENEEFIEPVDPDWRADNSLYIEDNVELENEEFIELVDPDSNDKLKTRKMYTPDAMELSLERYYDRDGVKVSDFSIHSSENAIYITYRCDPNFMSHVFRISHIIDPDHFNNYFINYFFNGFLADAYSLYYLLSLIYPTLYLD